MQRPYKTGGGGGSIGGTIDSPQVAYGSALDTIVGSSDFTYDGVLHVNVNTDEDPNIGVSVENNSAASGGTQQYSPLLRFRGHGWYNDGEGTTESRLVDYGIRNRTVTGNAQYGILDFLYAIDDTLDSAPTTMMSLEPLGTNLANLSPGTDKFLTLGLAAKRWAKGYFGSDSIGTAQTANLLVTNKTSAGAGAQQYSPLFELEGQGWKTNATAASQSVKWGVQTRPVQGAANPTGDLVFWSSINGGSYTEKMALSSGPTLKVGGTQVALLSDIPTTQHIEYSMVDVLNNGVTTSALTNGVYTYGMYFTLLKGGLKITGMRFWWPGGGGAQTAKCQIWDSSGTSLDVQNVSVNAAGVYTATWTSPITFPSGDVGKSYAVSVYDGVHYQSNTVTGYNNATITPGGSLNNIKAGPFYMQGVAHYFSGDGYPNLADSATLFPAHPTITD